MDIFGRLNAHMHNVNHPHTRPSIHSIDQLRYHYPNIDAPLRGIAMMDPTLAGKLLDRFDTTFDRYKIARDQLRSQYSTQQTPQSQQEYTGHAANLEDDLDMEMDAHKELISSLTEPQALHNLQWNTLFWKDEDMQDAMGMI